MSTDFKCFKNRICLNKYVEWAQESAWFYSSTVLSSLIWLVSGFPITFFLKERERVASTGSAGRVCRCHPRSGVRGVSQVTGLVGFHNSTGSKQAASPSFSVSGNGTWPTKEKILGGQQETSGSFRGILGWKKKRSIKHIYKYLFLQTFHPKAREIYTYYFL